MICYNSVKIQLFIVEEWFYFPQFKFITESCYIQECYHFPGILGIIHYDMISLDENDRRGNHFANNGVSDHLDYAKDWRSRSVFYYVRVFVWFSLTNNQVFSPITQVWTHSVLQQSFRI